MVSTDNEDKTGKSQESTIKEKNHAPPHISTPQRSLISNKNPENWYTDVLPSLPNRLSFLNFGKLHSTSARFQRLADEKDDFSRTIPSSSPFHIRGGVKRIFSQKMDWNSLWKISKDWIRKPVNLALFIWIVIVAISGAILFMVMTGMLNRAIPKKSQRDTWFEWRPEDILKLRKIYCKNGYKRVNRPFIGVGICISIAIVAPAFAGVYYILSPLGNDYGSESDEEAQLNRNDSRRKSFAKTFSFALRDEEVIVETMPKWSGGILDIWDDISLAYLSFFCTFCVFGWNMERLGFGNMYVHIATFLLFCLAPFWIFNLAAVNIDNEAVREAMGVTGILLCIFGLLYGGFWRIQMRKRLNLPPYSFCCNKPDFADCALWVFCCWCSLAQEVRTGNLYEIVDDKFCEKKDKQSPMSPLPREEQLRVSSLSPSRFSQGQSSSGRQISLMDEECLNSRDDTMRPPGISIICRETI